MKKLLILASLIAAPTHTYDLLKGLMLGSSTAAAWSLATQAKNSSLPCIAGGLAAAWVLKNNSYNNFSLALTAATAIPLGWAAYKGLRWATKPQCKLT